MGLRGLLLSGWASMPGALKQACRLGAVALLALGFLPSRAAAQTSISSCQTNPVSGVVNVTGNITATSTSPTPCITVGAGGATLNLNGYRIDISALGDTGVAIAIDTGATINTTINGINSTTLANAIIITNYQSSAATAAITSSGGTLSISGVTLDNEPGGQIICDQTDAARNWGTGITLNGVTGAIISGNTVSCYQVGISVQGSNITSHGGGSITGNNLFHNVYNQVGTNPVYNSAGLVLSDSSGWTVSGNTIEYNGSADASDTCVSSPPALITCAFGLQVINGSSNNSISNNPEVSNNFGGGIYTGPATSKNSISGNTARSNGTALQLNDAFDLWDDAPAHANHWHHNTCATVGGSVPSNAC